MLWQWLSFLWNFSAQFPLLRLAVQGKCLCHVFLCVFWKKFLSACIIYSFNCWFSVVWRKISNVVGSKFFYWRRKQQAFIVFCSLNNNLHFSQPLRMKSFFISKWSLKTIRINFELIFESWIISQWLFPEFVHLEGCPFWCSFSVKVHSQQIVIKSNLRKSLK